MKWFRFYHEAIDDPKVQLLEPPQFKFWVNFLSLASRSATRGIVTKSVGEIAFELRIPLADAQRWIDELKTVELIDVVATGLAPHNWSVRQPNSDDVTARVRGHRSARNGKATVHETPPATPMATLPVTPRETLDETFHATLPETPDETLVPSRAAEKELEREGEREFGTTSQAASAADLKPPQKVNGEWVPNGPAQSLVLWWANYANRGAMPSMFQPAVGAAQRLHRAGLTLEEAPMLYRFCAEFQTGVTLQKMAGQYDAWRSSELPEPSEEPLTPEQRQQESQRNGWRHGAPRNPKLPPLKTRDPARARAKP